MSKKMLLAAAVLALASCAAEKEAPFFRYCPNVQLVPEFSRMTQMAGKQEEAKIELIGYEGYCRTDLRNQTKAVVFRRGAEHTRQFPVKETAELLWWRRFLKFPAVRRLQTNMCVSAIIPIPATTRLP